MIKYYLVKNMEYDSIYSLNADIISEILSYLNISDIHNFIISSKDLYLLRNEIIIKNKIYSKSREWIYTNFYISNNLNSTLLDINIVYVAKILFNSKINKYIYKNTYKINKDYNSQIDFRKALSNIIKSDYVNNKVDVCNFIYTLFSIKQNMLDKYYVDQSVANTFIDIIIEINNLKEDKYMNILKSLLSLDILWKKYIVNSSKLKIELYKSDNIDTIEYLKLDLDDVIIKYIITEGSDKIIKYMCSKLQSGNRHKNIHANTNYFISTMIDIIVKHYDRHIKILDMCLDNGCKDRIVSNSIEKLFRSRKDIYSRIDNYVNKYNDNILSLLHLVTLSEGKNNYNNKMDIFDIKYLMILVKYNIKKLKHIVNSKFINSILESKYIKISDKDKIEYIYFLSRNILNIFFLDYFTDKQILNYIKNTQCRIYYILVRDLFDKQYMKSLMYIIKIYLSYTDHITRFERFDIALSYHYFLDLATLNNNIEIVVYILFNESEAMQYYNKLLLIATNKDNKLWIGNILNMYSLVEPTNIILPN